MPTNPAERRREGGDAQPREPLRVSRAALVGLGPALLLSGCGLLPGTGGPATPISMAGAAVTAVETALRQRAGALRRGRRDDFLAGVVADDAAFAARQTTYFENITQLPLARLRYSVVEDSVQDVGSEVSATVRLHLQLDGFDTRPVVTRKRVRFVRSISPGAGLLLAAEAEVPGSTTTLAPWDVGAIVVRSRPGVLGVFDDDSLAMSSSLLDAVAAGIGSVAAAVPYVWPRNVALYALSDIQVLASITDLPGGDPERIDGVAFPVHARPGGRIVAHRFMLHPRMLRRPGLARDRLIRHELVHVALGVLDDDVPTWLAEGLAEYISVQPIARQDRMISREALQTARGGLDRMPGNATFNGPLSGANYGISWWACEHIAAAYGVGMLWDLFDAFRRAGRGADEDVILQRELGIDSRTLAQEAGRRIIATFG